MSNRLLSLLLLTTSLWAHGLSNSVDKGVFGILKLTFPSSNWTFSKEQNPSDVSERSICHVNIDVGKGGLVFVEGYNKHCLHNRHTLKVIAANCLLRVNVSFSINLTLTERKAIYTIPLVLIDFYSNSDLTVDGVNLELSILQWRLSEILPIELLKTNNSIANSKLSNLFVSWDIRTIPWKSDVKLNNLTDVILQVYTPAKVRHLYKRQLFSNLHIPEFIGSPYTVSIQEGLPLATQVIEIKATDADEGSAGEIKYSLHADVDQRSLGVFLIDEDTGWVTTNGVVDREDIDEHKFTVRAVDQGSPANSAQTMLTIIVQDFNDHAPSFEQPRYNLNVSETVTVNSTISRILAADADLGNNKVILYSIVDAASVTDFTINRTTGDLSVARPLNREQVANYSFTVMAQDQADNIADRLSSTVTVNVLILDYNDNVPQFAQSSYTLTVREDINVSSGPVVIGSITATDLDYGVNKLIRYEVFCLYFLCFIVICSLK